MSKRFYFTHDELAEYPKNDPSRVFAQDVADNPHLHNRWVHLACKRHTLDLIAAKDADFPFIYDCAKADRPAKFAEQFKGVEGPLAGSSLKFLPWQRFIVAQVYGWRMRADERKRRFRYAYIEVPRKNGKTGFIAPLGVYQLAFPPPNARCDIYSVATKEDQAKIVWKDACRLLKTAPNWSPLFRAKTKSLTHVRSDSVWMPLGSDSDTLDGLRPELAIMDELHKWSDRQLWDVFNNAFGAAFSPLIFQITTSGDDTETICYEQHKRVEKVLNLVADKAYANSQDTDASYYFGCIWTRDEGDEWDNPQTWQKANPSLGLVKPVSEIEVGLDAARASEGARRAFLRDHLNEWGATGVDRFLDMDAWRSCHEGEPLTYADTWERLRGLPVWMGLDPSSARDITALCAIADDPDEPGAIRVAWDFWVPGANLAVRCAKEELPYDQWAREQWLFTTEGDCIDINEIKRQCLYRRENLDVQTMGFDEGMSQGIGIALTNDHGFPALKVGQGFWLAPALQEIERLTLAGLLKHGGNPIARAHANAAVVFRGDSRIKLSKGKSKSRIDGMAALAMAMAARQTAKANPTGRNPFLFL